MKPVVEKDAPSAVGNVTTIDSNFRLPRFKAESELKIA